MKRQPQFKNEDMGVPIITSRLEELKNEDEECLPRRTGAAFKAWGGFQGQNGREHRSTARGGSTWGQGAGGRVTACRGRGRGRTTCSGGAPDSCWDQKQQKHQQAKPGKGGTMGGSRPQPRKVHGDNTGRTCDGRKAYCHVS